MRNKIIGNALYNHRRLFIVDDESHDTTRRVAGTQ
ncbi:hypothetical protein SLEP1_g49254 [Rubroshorea leprosula]|uniref:Uncharacterized protein n=1 Tax=Rubroshorea leprosula TaxID=152421 RepID=A0AAV5LX70_9ROSI|nr:hypothetical protein SLEP1_g49254 [Rubroshorea leprosula]